MVSDKRGCKIVHDKIVLIFISIPILILTRHRLHGIIKIFGSFFLFIIALLLVSLLICPTGIWQRHPLDICPPNPKSNKESRASIDRWLGWLAQVCVLIVVRKYVSARLVLWARIHFGDTDQLWIVLPY